MLRSNKEFFEISVKLEESVYLTRSVLEHVVCRALLSYQFIWLVS